MKRTLRIWTVCGVMATLAVAGALIFPETSKAQAPPKTMKYEVILMNCNADKSNFAIKAFQGSPNTPGRQTGDCADNLSLLMKEGFEIRDIGHYDEVDAPFVLYTLVR